MAHTSDLVIVGGGIIGMTTAYVLAKEGLRVTILDRQNFGQEASWAGAGIIPPGDLGQAVSPFDKLRSASAASFPELSAELRERTGIDNGYIRCGGLEFADGEAATLPEEWRGAGIDVEHLTEAATRLLEPALAPGLGAAHLLPDLAQLRNPRHVKALVAAASILKVELKPYCPAQGWQKSGGRVQGVRTEHETYQAANYLVAAGAGRTIFSPSWTAISTFSRCAGKSPC